MYEVCYNTFFYAGKGSDTPQMASGFIKANRNWILEQIESVTDYFGSLWVHTCGERTYLFVNFHMKSSKQSYFRWVLYSRWTCTREWDMFILLHVSAESESRSFYMYMLLSAVVLCNIGALVMQWTYWYVIQRQCNLMCKNCFSAHLIYQKQASWLALLENLLNSKCWL